MSNSVETPMLSQANALAQGMDIFGARDISSFLKLLVSPHKAQTSTITFLGKDFSVPEYVNLIQDTKTYQEDGVCETREELQNKLAAHVGVEGAYGAFSGEMKSDFSTEFNSNSHYVFAYRNFYSSIGELQFQFDENLLSNEFLAALEALPFEVTEENSDTFAQFFRDFGIYYTDKVVLGGSLEFFTAINKSSDLGMADISAMMTAQYEGLFSSGKVDASVQASTTWQSYSSNSRTTVKANGGDPVKASALSMTDPLHFSSETVGLFKEWGESVKDNPAIVDFTVRGIWEICGTKRQAVQEAWEKYAKIMHPLLNIYVQSQILSVPPQHPILPPTLYLSGIEMKPANASQNYEMGFQVTILEATDVTNVLFNKYYPVDGRGDVTIDEWPKTWEALMSDVHGHYDNPNNILILTTYSWARYMFPSIGAVGLLRNAGAGSLLEKWSVDRKDSKFSWFPADYVLVGVFGNGPDSGVEVYRPFNANPVTSTQVNVRFYQETFSGNYTIGLGQ